MTKREQCSTSPFDGCSVLASCIETVRVSCKLNRRTSTSSSGTPSFCESLTTYENSGKGFSFERERERERHIGRAMATESLAHACMHARGGPWLGCDSVAIWHVCVFERTNGMGWDRMHSVCIYIYIYTWTYVPHQGWLSGMDARLNRE